MSTLPTPIRSPGVDIVQSARQEPAVVSIPILVPVAVGPCFKVLEATNDDGTLNEEARLGLPAQYMAQTFLGVATGTPTHSPALVAPETLAIQVNGGAALSVVFAINASGYTLQEVADAINAAAELGGTSVVADVVPVSTTNGLFRLRTTGAGDGWGLDVAWSGADTVLATWLSLPLSWHSVGTSQYDGRRMLLTTDLLPDPWTLGVDKDVQLDSIRSFLTTSSVVKKEQYRTQAVSRCGGSYLGMVDDHDGDGTTPLLKFIKNAMQVTVPHDVKYTAALPAVAGLTGLASTPLAAVLVSTNVATWAAGAHTFQLGIDGWEKQTIVATPALGTLTTLELRDAINARFPGRAASTGINTTVTITSRLFGREGEIWIQDNADSEELFDVANALGVPNPITRGDWQAVHVGDEIWVDGTLFGTVTELVTVDGTGTDDQEVRLDTEYSVAYFSILPVPVAEGTSARDWYIVSKGLSSQMEALTPGLTPTPELFVSSYFVQLRHDVLRGTKGEPLYVPVTPTDSTMYDSLFYKALRLDVTARATTRIPAPISITSNDYTSLENQFSPIDAQNPLGLAGFFMLENSGLLPILLLGVDEVSDTYPEGTPDAYARAFALLKGYRGYGIAPLSQDIEVGQNLDGHVLYMSATKKRNWRFGFMTAPVPQYDEPTLIASGTEGNAAAGPATAFNTSVADLGDLFVAAGITAHGVWSATGSDGIYLQIEGDTNKYLIASYSGSQLTCIAYTGTDGKYATAMWVPAIIDKAFSISKEGAELVDTAGLPDKMAIACAIGKRAARFNTRRMCLGAPAEVSAVVDGLEQWLPTYYLAAATVALRCALPPSQPLSNVQIQGFTGLRKANGYFDEEQMDQAAGYGVWWWYVDDNGVVRNRHQLTTDPSSLKTREQSYTSGVDFGSYMFLDMVQKMTGSMSLNDLTLDLLYMVSQGVIDVLLKSKVWTSVNNFAITPGPFPVTPEDLAEGLSAGGEDEVAIDFDANLPPPLNRVRIRMRF